MATQGAGIEHRERQMQPSISETRAQAVLLLPALVTGSLGQAEPLLSTSGIHRELATLPDGTARCQRP